MQKALAAQGIGVTVEKAGSRAIAGRYDAAKDDFGFPSGGPAAVQLRQQAKAACFFSGLPPGLVSQRVHLSLCSETGATSLLDSLVALAGFVQAFAAQAVEAEFCGQRQHQAATA